MSIQHSTNATRRGRCYGAYAAALDVGEAAAGEYAAVVGDLARTKSEAARWITHPA